MPPCFALSALHLLTSERGPCFNCALRARSGARFFAAPSADQEEGFVSVPIRLSPLRLCVRILAASVLAIGLATIAEAQILYGSVVGVVRDGTGAVMPGATVTIVNRDTNLTRETTTNSEGAYSIINVLPGPYDVKVTLAGFRDVARNNVPVTINEIARVDVTMEVGAVSETVMVVGESPILQTDKSDVHTQLKSDAITQMPLNRYRNYQALLNLAPGTTPMAFGNAETDTPARSLATNVNGQPNTQNSTRTDGATNMNIWLPNHLMYVSPAETVDTVDVSTSSFDAEQGMAGGAAVTVITKSGTNNFRGSAIEYFNNQALNAKPYFFGVGAAPDKLPVKTNNYGATLGGPIKRNRVFFFGSFEGYKRRQSLFTFFTVPDAALRAGDFSKAFNTNGSLQQIYNPLTGNADGTGRQAFANNQIPSGLVNPIAQKILNLFPLPNIQGIGAGGLTNNYQRPEDRAVDRENYDGKVNWNRTSAHQIWAKFSHMHAVVDDLSNYLGVPTVKGSGGNTKVYQFTAGQTWTLSPTVLMDQTFGFSRQKHRQLRPRRPWDSRHQRPGYRRPALRGISRVPVRRHDLGLLQPTGQPRRLEPDLPRRADVLDCHQPHQGCGAARLPRRVLPEFPVSRSLAAGNRQPPRTIPFQREHDRAARRPDRQLLQRVCLVSPWGGRQSPKERAERADDVARVAARPVLPRPMDADHEADAGPRAPVGGVPDHASRRRAGARPARS
ncbi:MAG: hypothetical protein DMG01_27495, partial [Acidobacteria bacterium]